MSNQNVNCLKCTHFFVTWDKSFPRGCKLFGFKTKTLPSHSVLEATGTKCTNFKSRVK